MYNFLPILNSLNGLELKEDMGTMPFKTPETVNNYNQTIYHDSRAIQNKKMIKGQKYHPFRQVAIKT
jgi:hypothetical protein